MTDIVDRLEDEIAAMVVDGPGAATALNMRELLRDAISEIKRLRSLGQMLHGGECFRDLKDRVVQRSVLPQVAGQDPLG